MNYVGSISILDRGDAPAQAVLDRNARSLAQRVAEETKEELGRVLCRVDHIYDNFDLTSQLHESNRAANLEYVNDLVELEDLLQDQVKKKKYQQQLTVFVVGYENVCGQKLRLLQQVNDFFMENTAKFDDDDIGPRSPDLDLDDMAESVEDSLKTAGDLAKRLGELNKEMTDYMYNYAQAKASNKGKKKLEKALSQAKDDIQHLNEKLLSLQQDIEEKEDKMQQLFKQVEMKNMEMQRYKTAAEVAKKNVEEADRMMEEIKKRDQVIKDLQKVIGQMEIDVGAAEHSKEMSQNRLTNAGQETQAKLNELQEALDNKTVEKEEAKRELQRMHSRQMDEMREEHKLEIDKLTEQHNEEIKKLLGEDAAIDEARSTALSSLKQESSWDLGESTWVDSEPDLEESVQSKGVKTTPKKESRRGSQLKTRKSTSEKIKEVAEVGVQDEDGDPDKSVVETTTRPLPPLVEDIVEFDDHFALTDEDSWSVVPPQEVPSRFAQYRKLAVNKIEELEGEVAVTVKKTTRKINTLKAQFQEHKQKWEKEHEVMVDQVEQAHKLQSAAEKEADAAMAQLEDFINEQELLEREEETKRSALSVEPDEIRAPSAEEQIINDQAEQELQQKLLEQTDDAKAEMSRKASILQTDSESQQAEEEITGDNPEAVRESSARSRASLRMQHRNSLNSLKAASDERRLRSPTMTPLLSQRSFISEAELDENGDMPFPEDVGESEFHQKVSTHDIGTSPMTPGSKKSSASRKGIPIADHPIVEEYLKTYDTIVQFKDTLTRVFVDKDMMSAGQVLTDIEAIEFSRDKKVFPQVELMSNNVYNILEESVSLVNNLLSADRDYPVSSLNPSRNQTMMSEKPPADSVPTSALANRSRTKLQSSAGQENNITQQLRALQSQYALLQRRLEEEGNKHNEQLHHNTVVMMEMQDTINALQRELSLMHKSADNPDSQIAADSPIMFTRLDSERNAKVLKRAVNEQRLEEHTYKDAVKTMEEYVSLPAKRFVHLVHKYVHHCQMKEIEENVRKSNSLNENVFMVLDKMEALQNVRAQRWAEQMDNMGEQRLQLAHMLMDALDNIERESGIFLIKPNYSYRGTFDQDKYHGKLSRPFRPRQMNTFQGQGGTFQGHDSTGLGPTPASHIRTLQQLQSAQGIRPSSQSQDGILGKAPLLGDYPRPVWNPHSSQGVAGGVAMHTQFGLNTPRLLELDINRMLIGQNQVSMKVSPGGLADDRLTNAANSSVRSYITVNRPARQPILDRPRSASAGLGEHTVSVPPTTPMLRDFTPGSEPSTRRPSHVDENVRPIPSTPPLPPINPSRGVDKNAHKEAPSPPGSSQGLAQPTQEKQPIRIGTHLQSRPSSASSAASES